VLAGGHLIELNTLARVLADASRLQLGCCGQLARCVAKTTWRKASHLSQSRRLRTCALGGGAVVRPCATHATRMGWRAYKAFQPAARPVAPSPIHLTIQTTKKVAAVSRD